MAEQMVCTECGSGSLVASGVFEHGTWIYRLTCWTCRDCRTVVAVAASDVSHDAGSPVSNTEQRR